MPVEVTVALDSVETQDAAPFVAPYRISDKAGHDAVEWTFRPCASGVGVIDAWRVVLDAPDDSYVPASGSLLAHGGAICGLDTCGHSMPLALPQGTAVTVSKTYTDAGAPADGDHPVDTYATGGGVWGA